MSEIITDKLTGKTSAGDVTITSEGGSATMQLQQGIAKVWAYHEDQSVTDSLNVSSGTDTSAGVFDLTFTNAFSTDDWSGQYTHEDAQNYISASGRSSTTLKTVSKNDSGSVVDATDGNVVVHGDLA